jgi:hypothetical protein
VRRLKRQVRRGQKHKSPPTPTAGRRREASDSTSPPLPPHFVFLPNAHDQLAVATLRSARVGELAIDRLVGNDPQMVSGLREATVEVYRNAAQIRQTRKATKVQIREARSALRSLTSAIRQLERVSTDGRDGLRMLLEGSPLDDERGEREVNGFAARCWKIRLDIAPSALELQSAIEAESEKSSATGERRKRLRTLVDSLATWWLRGGGKTLAPYVKANRRNDGPAVVHERTGMFLKLAVALFCGVDVFKNSEVEAAVTNVHEHRLPSKVRKAST